MLDFLLNDEFRGAGKCPDMTPESLCAWAETDEGACSILSLIADSFEELQESTEGETKAVFLATIAAARYLVRKYKEGS